MAMRWLGLALMRSLVAVRRLLLHHRGAVMVGTLLRPKEQLEEPAPLPLNTVGRDEADLLRVVSRYGDELHLARLAGRDEAPRPALHPKRAARDRDELREYHGEMLCVPQWSHSTVCGETWWQMASHRVEIAMLATGRRLMCPTCAAMTHPTRLNQPSDPS